jgi:hypothetical protein
MRTLTFSYNHILKVLNIVLAIMFGLAVSNCMDAYSHLWFMAHVLLLPKKNYVLRKGHVENDDSYVEEWGCPLFPLLLQISQNHNRAPLLASEWTSPQNEQTNYVLRKGHNIDYG